MTTERLSMPARASETSAHRIEGEADPLLVVTDGAPGLIAGADPRRNGDDYPMTSCSDQSAWSAIGPAGSLPRVPGAPRVRAGPSHRHARLAAGDRPVTRRRVETL